MNTFNKIISTSSSAAPLIARVALALVIFPHGAQKALGWFDGYGYTGTMGFFTVTLGIPAVFGFLAIVAEFAGSIALFAGALSRASAFGIGSVMAVAALQVHVGNGFFMNWSGSQAGEGYEFHLLVIGLALVVMVAGGGKWSVDAYLSRPAVPARR